MKKSSFANDLYHDMLKNVETKSDSYLADKEVEEALTLISEAALIFNECNLPKEAKALNSILKKLKG